MRQAHGAQPQTCHPPLPDHIHRQDCVRAYIEHIAVWYCCCPHGLLHAIEATAEIIPKAMYDPLDKQRKISPFWTCWFCLSSGCAWCSIGIAQCPLLGSNRVMRAISRRALGMPVLRVW